MTDSIKLPSSFDPSKDDIEQYDDVLRWLEDQSTNVYVKSDFVNQFFLLHGITGFQFLFRFLIVFQIFITWSMIFVTDYIN